MMVSSHTVGHGPGPTGAAEKAAGPILEVTEAIKVSYMLLTCLVVLLSRNMIRIVLYKKALWPHGRAGADTGSEAAHSV